MTPLALRATLAAAVLVIVTGLTWLSYVKVKSIGAAEERVVWQAKLDAIERAAQERAKQNQQVITKTITKFVTKAAEDRVVYRDQIKEVEKYVPSTLPLLPADFRVYHDAAAAGVPIPAAGDTARADAAPVAPTTVAATIADNYAACRYDQERLEALQAIVRALTHDAQTK